MTSSRNSATPSKSDGRQTRQGQRNFYMPLHTALYFCWTFDNSTGIETHFIHLCWNHSGSGGLLMQSEVMLQKPNADAHRSCLYTHGLLGWLLPSNLPAARGCFGQHRSLGWEGTVRVLDTVRFLHCTAKGSRFSGTLVIWKQQQREERC